MDELLDIVDENGNLTGRTALKSKAHSTGLYHNTIHVWFYTKDNSILLQQRSHKKTIYPLLWDVSVAGHIHAGESFKDAAIRETQEEIGLLVEPKRLKPIGTFLHENSYNNGQIQDNEFHQVFIALLDVPMTDLKIDKDEVEALKLVSFIEFDQLLKNSSENLHFIASNRRYYEFVLQKIKENNFK